MNRVENLKRMHEEMMMENDERAYDIWCVFGVPDEADEEDYTDIASDDEAYEEVLDLYAEIKEKIKEWEQED
jgi:hypothetical protein